MARETLEQAGLDEAAVPLPARKPEPPQDVTLGPRGLKFVDDPNAGNYFPESAMKTYRDPHAKSYRRIAGF